MNKGNRTAIGRGYPRELSPSEATARRVANVHPNSPARREPRNAARNDARRIVTEREAYVRELDSRPLPTDSEREEFRQWVEDAIAAPPGGIMLPPPPEVIPGAPLVADSEGFGTAETLPPPGAPEAPNHPPVIDSVPPEAPEVIPVAAPRFSCIVCGAEFDTPRGVASHKGRAHKRTVAEGAV